MNHTLHNTSLVRHLCWNWWGWVWFVFEKSEVNIKHLRRCYEERVAMMVMVGNSLGTGVFFSRQLLILCDSKGPYLLGPRWSTTLWIFFFFLNLIPTISRFRQISEMKVWKRPVRVSQGVKRSQTQGPGPYLHDADSTKWKISGNYRLAFWPCGSGKSKKKKKNRSQDWERKMWFISLRD